MFSATGAESEDSDDDDDAVDVDFLLERLEPAVELVCASDFVDGGKSVYEALKATRPGVVAGLRARL